MEFWLGVAREFGVPLAILAFFAWAIVTGILVPGRQLRSQAKDQEERLAYTEARRIEEREARLKAEHQLARTIETSGDAQRTMIALLGDIEKEVIRGTRDRLDRGPAPSQAAEEPVRPPAQRRRGPRKGVDRLD